jgi:hypothetical protein
VALEHNNTAFETMLRRHLKRGGAPVAPCGGFDADAASAYLERALDAAGQLRFETHMAGCAACRCHLIELARMPQPVVLPVLAQPARAAKPARKSWAANVAGWFDLSNWNWGWAAATAGCAVLLTGVALQAWRQSASFEAAKRLMPVAEKSQDAMPQAMPQLFALEQSGSVAAPAATPVAIGDTNAELALAEAEREGKALVIARLAELRKAEAARARSAPAPPLPLSIPPSGNPATDLLAALTVAKSLNLAASEASFGSQPLPAPSAPPNRASALTVSLRETAAISVRPEALKPGDGIVHLPSAFAGDFERKESANNAPPPAGARPREAQSAKGEKNNSNRNRDLLRSLKGGMVSSFMPTNKPDKTDVRTKEADTNESPDQRKPLFKRLNGHTFHYDHGFWIDEDYKSDTKLPIIRLARGSKDYQQALIENPTLEQFFQLGQVIVVWKGKVYEVRKQ